MRVEEFGSRASAMATSSQDYGYLTGADELNVSQPAMNQSAGKISRFIGEKSVAIALKLLERGDSVTAESCSGGLSERERERESS